MDSFLAHHRISDQEYEIGGGFLNVSVRDMMLRARLLIDRLVKLRNLQPGQRILIVGAGVSGITAALRAAEKYRLKPVVVEQDAVPLQRFAACTTRQLEPYLYTWPAPGWNEQAFPAPLGGDTGTPNTLVRQWLNSHMTTIAGRWEFYNTNLQTLAKREANRISYFVDELVKKEISNLPQCKIIGDYLMSLSRVERRLFAKTLFERFNSLKVVAPERVAHYIVAASDNSDMNAAFKPKNRPIACISADWRGFQKKTSHPL